MAPMHTSTHWHALPVEAVFARFGVTQEGLSDVEAKKRLTQFGPNTLPEPQRFLALTILRRQLESFFTLILAAAGAISFFLGEITDAVVLGGAIVLNITVGFVQEYRAERALKALKKILAPEATVIRNNQIRRIFAQDVVPGDLLLFAGGDKIAADVRLIECMNLEINEATLTGESVAVAKRLGELPEGATVPERLNMAFSGTIAVRGQGKGIVVASGKDTYFGEIAQSLSDIPEEQTNLQKSLTDLARKLTAVVLALSFLIFIFGLLAKHDLSVIFTTSVAIAVAAIPEGLLVAVTVILAIGTQRLLRQKALVRKLQAVETLGRTTLICVDKTGTVTEGKMSFEGVYPVEDDPDVKARMFKAMTFANEAVKEEVITHGHSGVASWRFIGDPTDIVMLEAASLMGFEQLYHERGKKLVDLLPFESKNQFMAVLVKDNNEKVMYLKGAAEQILPKSEKFLGKHNEVHRLTPELKKDILKRHDEFTAKAFRVIAFAERTVPQETRHFSDIEPVLEDLVFLGFITLEDPLREGVKDAIDEAQGAGIKIALITGDHVLTARSVAEKLGIGDGKNVLTGKDLEELSDKELVARVGSSAIFARTLPQQKLRIVDAFQAAGDTVCMTGDGINDAPAMKGADIGIALGSGTDVAKETAEMVLIDDRFSTIVAAVREGRIVFENIRKVAIFLLFDSFSEIVLVAGALMLGLPLPLTAAMILWMNLIEDGPPAFALAFESGEKDVMKWPPRGAKETLLPRKIFTLVVGFGVAASFIPLALFWYFVHHGAPLAWAQTIVFAFVAIDSFTIIFSLRSLHKPVWRMNPLGNPWILWAVALGIALMAVATQAPFFQEILGTTALNAGDWIFVFVIGIANLLILELFKALIFIDERKRMKSVNSMAQA